MHEKRSVKAALLSKMLHEICVMKVVQGRERQMSSPDAAAQMTMCAQPPNDSNHRVDASC